MEWQIIVALVVMTPIILIPVVLVWYLNSNGIPNGSAEAEDQRTAGRK